jgi:alpha-tubulin suppressor-like RCC1 family protein
VKKLKNIIKVNTRINHNIALDREGRVYQWGLQEVKFLK